MSFGRNPHVAKAEVAEQKALAASDEAARSTAWRDAARLWERASEREVSEKRRAEYAQRAETARRAADGEGADGEGADGEGAPVAAPPPRSALN